MNILYLFPLLAAIIFVVLNAVFIGEDEPLIDRAKQVFLLSIINYSLLLSSQYCSFPSSDSLKDAVKVAGKSTQESIITGPPKFTPF